MAPKDTGYLEIAHKRAAEKKTHVSFPQLKYPSLRDQGLKDSVQWLEGKAMDDGAEGLWRVHDKIYDVTRFVDRHPGGAEWLELTKGTDITEAFEAHHLTSVAPKLLEDYYIRDAKTPRNSPFTFKDDGFFRTLKREVVAELKNIPRTKISYTNLIIDGLFGTMLITSALSCWSTNYWVKMVSYLVASLTLAWTTVAAHNYLHKKSNWRMYLFNFSMWSYREFRVSHALSHHLYPNTLMDLEVSAFEPLVMWNPRKKPIHANLALLIELIIYPTLFIQNFLKRFIANFIRKDYFKKHYKWHDLLGLTLPLWIYVVSGATFYDAITSWLWINCTGSFIFYLIGSNAAHHHPRIFKDGDQVESEICDWGIHELRTVMDRKDINGNLFKVMTFFGDHALHHLFPTLDHALLPHLYPVFYRNVKKFKGDYKISSSVDLFLGQIKMARKMDPTLLDDSDLEDYSEKAVALSE